MSEAKKVKQEKQEIKGRGWQKRKIYEWSKKQERKMNEEIGRERDNNKEVREKTNAVTSYCNLAKLQLVIISNIHNSYC